MNRPACFPDSLTGEMLSLEPLLFQLWRPFRYIDCKDTITVPAGFCTDFTSIPRVFHNILSPMGAYGYAAVVHDYLYSTGEKSRRCADGYLLDGMCDSGVWYPTALLIWGCVRLFGSKHYTDGVF